MSDITKPNFHGSDFLVLTIAFFLLFTCVFATAFDILCADCHCLLLIMNDIA